MRNNGRLIMHAPLTNGGEENFFVRNSRIGALYERDSITSIMRSTHFHAFVIGRVEGIELTFMNRRERYSGEGFNRGGSRVSEDENRASGGTLEIIHETGSR